MKKRLLPLILTLCLAVSLAVPAWADGDIYYVKLCYAENLDVLPPGAVAVDGPANTTPGPYDFTLPEGPVRPGFAFTGWKLANTVYQPGDTVTVTGDRIFYAQWTATHPFTDLPEATDYFYPVIELWQQGLMVGTSSSKFSPEGTFTRAMLWTVLARMAGEETGGDPWYAQAQAWAVDAGVSDGSSPNQAVSRQELLTMLYRQAGSPAVEAKGLDAFPGADQIADWARDAMWWALDSKVLYNPQGGGTLVPTGAVPRLEVAVSVSRLNALTPDQP